MIFYVDDAASDALAGKTVYYDGAAWAEIQGSGGSTLPVADTTSIAKGSADGTKQVRFEADGITTSTTRVLTIADLPPRNTKRWVIRRKAEVVAAVRGGLLSLEEACARYTLTVEEFLSWQQSIDSHGLAGLRTTRIQQYRP
jgi:hypothetical protein